MMARLPLSLALGALLLLGGGTVFSTLAGTPAFNDKLQEQGIMGRQRVPFAPAMYHLSEYLQHVATTFLQADFLPAGISLIDGESGPAGIKVAIARADRASQLLSQSVALAPADANGWQMLSRSLMMSGQPEKARKALHQSWELAPYNRQIAVRRLSVVRILFAQRSGTLEGVPHREPTKQEKESVARDLEVLRMLSPSEYRRYANRLPSDFN